MTHRNLVESSSLLNEVDLCEELDTLKGYSGFTDNLCRHSEALATIGDVALNGTVD